MCWECGKIGHLSRDCPTRSKKPTKQNEMPGAPRYTSILMVRSERDDPEAIILDSGASDHMCRY